MAKRSEFEFSEDQQKAYDSISSGEHDVNVLVGGAGCGKTALSLRLIAETEGQCLVVTMMNRTKKMIEKKYLERGVNLPREQFRGSDTSQGFGSGLCDINYHHQNCDEKKARHPFRHIEFRTLHSAYYTLLKVGEVYEPDTLLIDEAGMVSNGILSDLLCMVKPSRIIFVGDPNQLPPIDRGDILNTVMSYSGSNVHRLSTVHRTSDDSKILLNASRILSSPLTSFNALEYGVSFERHKVSIGKDFSTQIERIYSESNTMFVAYRRVDCLLINLIIQRKVNRGKSRTLKRTWVNTKTDRDLFQVNGIKVSQTMNGKMYIDEMLFPGDLVKATHTTQGTPHCINCTSVVDGQLFQDKDGCSEGCVKGDGKINNGDFGVVLKNFKVYYGSTGVLEEVQSKQVRGRTTYEYESGVSIAYCITVHTSQGDEFDHVCIFLPTSPPFAHQLGRNFIYTAVTRAKKSVILLSVDSAISYFNRPRIQIPRKTFLLDMLEDTDSFTVVNSSPVFLKDDNSDHNPSKKAKVIRLSSSVKLEDVSDLELSVIDVFPIYLTTKKNLKTGKRFTSDEVYRLVQHISDQQNGKLHRVSDRYRICDRLDAVLGGNTYLPLKDILRRMYNTTYNITYAKELLDTQLQISLPSKCYSSMIEMSDKIFGDKNWCDAYSLMEIVEEKVKNNSMDPGIRDTLNSCSIYKLLHEEYGQKLDEFLHIGVVQARIRKLEEVLTKFRVDGDDNVVVVDEYNNELCIARELSS